MPLEPTPDQVAPTPASPMQSASDGVTDTSTVPAAPPLSLAERKAAILAGAQLGMQQAAEAAAWMNSPSVRQSMDWLRDTLASPGLRADIESTRAKMRQFVDDLGPSAKFFDQEPFGPALAALMPVLPPLDLAKFGLPALDTLMPTPRHDFDLLSLPMPPRPATSAEMRRLEEQIADLQDDMRALQDENRQLRRPIVETNLRTEQMHRHFVPDEPLP